MSYIKVLSAEICSELIFVFADMSRHFSQGVTKEQFDTFGFCWSVLAEG